MYFNYGLYYDWRRVQAGFCRNFINFKTKVEQLGSNFMLAKKQGEKIYSLRSDMLEKYMKLHVGAVLGV